MENILSVADRHPQVAESAWVAPGSHVIGSVSLGEEASVWYGARLRADAAKIDVGRGTNLQDNVVVHSDEGFDCSIGNGVTVGHAAVIHGCTIEDNCLIGIGAIILNGAQIRSGSLVAAGAVVLPGSEFPGGMLIAGVPAKVRRELTDDEKASIQFNADHYQKLKSLHSTD